MFKPDLRTYTVEALTKRGVEVQTGEVVESVSPARVKLKSGKELKAHTLVWGAGLQGNALVQSLGLELERGNRIAVDADLRIPSHPEVFVVGDIAAITDPKTSRCCRSWARWRSSRASTPARRSRSSLQARRRSPSSTRTRGRWRRSDAASAVVQMLGGKTMKGKKAQLAWGTVHLALLPTNEDRAKAVVDWAGAGLTHERSARISVET